MASQATFEFPALIGGVPLPLDFAPAILFSVLYGLLTPVVLYRLIQRRSRTFVLVGTGGFVIERTVAYALRAHAAHNAAFRASQGLEIYLQVAVNAGFITIGQDTLTLLRALLVDSTFGAPGESSRRDASTTTLTMGAMPQRSTPNTSNSEDRGASKYSDGFVDFQREQRDRLPIPSEQAGPGEREDLPGARNTIRQICGIGALVFLAVVIMSIIAGVDYHETVRDGAHASQVQVLRYASSGIVLFLLVSMICGMLYAMARMPRVPTGRVLRLLVICILLSIVAVYRLIVMRYWVTALLSTAPGSQNTTGAKTLWWVFHATPELLASTLLVTVNLREKYKTGPWGDLTSEKPAR